MARAFCTARRLLKALGSLSINVWPAAMVHGFFALCKVSVFGDVKQFFRIRACVGIMACTMIDFDGELQVCYLFDR